MSVVLFWLHTEVLIDSVDSEMKSEPFLWSIFRSVSIVSITLSPLHPTPPVVLRSSEAFARNSVNLHGISLTIRPAATKHQT